MRSESTATAAKATLPYRAASSRAPSSAGTSRRVSSWFDTPKKRLVSSGPIGASESVEGRTSIETEYAASSVVSASPSSVRPRMNIGPSSPPVTEQSPSSVTRGAASPEGNQPSARFTAIAVPIAVDAPRG